MVVLHDLEAAREAIQQLSGLQCGKISVACAGSQLIVPSIISFHRRYPDIHISVAELSTEDTKKKLLQNELDFGMVLLPLVDR